MEGRYDQEIREADVVYALDHAGLRWRDAGRYLVTQCPLHDDRNPSTQIFKNDWFVSCLSGCGRFHISQAFPELKGGAPIERNYNRRSEPMGEQYRAYDGLATFHGLAFIPRSHDFKNIPLAVLDELGWRWSEAKDSYFIPYWNERRDQIPFAQWRHLSGTRRFSFERNTRIILYGKQNISPGERLFIVEGTSDGAVMQHCGVPWIAVPSASLGSLLANFGRAAAGLGISLVYAGDKDPAGDKLLEALDSSGAHYRVCQPPDPYKDWGEFYEANGTMAVFDHCKERLFE